MLCKQDCRQDLLQWMAWAEDRLTSAGVPNPRVDAETLLATALGLERLDLYLNPKPLEETDREILQDHVERRSRREPLQYILGEVSFFGRSFRVDRSTLIPRPETELLIQGCLQRIDRPGRILDIGTGSGCIAVTLACELPGTRVVAVDAEKWTLSVARGNARRHGVNDRIRWVCGNLTTAIRDDYQADLLVANLPYIPEPELNGLQAEVRDFEPVTALSGGEDGLALMRRLFTRASKVIRPRGLLALEIGDGQGKDVSSLIQRSAAFEKIEIVEDLAGRSRMVFAIRSA